MENEDHDIESVLNSRINLDCISATPPPNLPYEETYEETCTNGSIDISDVQANNNIVSVGGNSLDLDEWIDNFLASDMRRDMILPDDFNDLYNQIINRLRSCSVDERTFIYREIRSCIEGLNNNYNYNNVKSYFHYLLTQIGTFSTYKVSNNDLNNKNDDTIPFTIGFEYTYHFDKDHDRELIADNVKNKLKKRKLYFRSYIDSNVMEICSPVHTNYQEIIDYYNAVTDLSSELKLTTYQENEPSGGLHFNISFNEEYKLAYINFFIMISNYPELNWIFNDPLDKNSSKSIFPKIRKIYKKNHLSIDKFYLSLLNINGKRNGINCKSNVLFELRIFQMARDEEELKDFLDFTFSLFNFCKEMADDNIMFPLLDHEFIIFDDTLVFKDKESNFKNLLEVLDLDINRYDKYVKRNYKERLKLGINYLV